MGGEPAAGHLLKRFSRAGVSKAVVVLREGKWDIPEELLRYEDLDVDLAYVVVSETPGELFSAARGLAFVGNNLVALGYPDVLFEPETAFTSLIDRQRRTRADVVLGLFPCESPERVDMVALDAESRPIEIVIKKSDRGLRYSWSIAVWSPVFSRYLTEFVSTIDMQGRATWKEGNPEEVSVGHVIQEALTDGITVESVTFDDGGFLDIGTPADLALARRRRG